MKIPVTKRGMIQTALGSVFYLLNDGRTLNGNNATTSNIVLEKPPILCFHMSPRSSDEYFEVLPLLASGSSSLNDTDSTKEEKEGGENIDGRIVIAFDLPGYGVSENPPRSCTIDEMADALLMAADSILSDTISTDDGDQCENGGSSSNNNQHRNYVTIGSLLGNYFCVSLASRYPERIKAGILTNPWFNPAASDPPSSSLDATDPPPPATSIEDSFVLKDDGSHLVELHSKRNRWLDPELNFRVVSSEISYLAKRRIRFPKGINIQGGKDYDFQAPVRKIVEMRGETNADSACSNFLCIIGETCATMFDRIGLDGTKRFDEACQMLLGGDEAASSGSSTIVRVERLVGEKSTLNLVNQMPEDFAAICNKFLSERGL